MSRNKQVTEFEIEVRGEPYIWRLQRQPQWSSDISERRGMIVAVCHRDGQRDAFLEFPAGQQPRFGVKQMQVSQIPAELVAKAVASALDAGWEPFSRGKPVAIMVDATGG